MMMMTIAKGANPFLKSVGIFKGGKLFHHFLGELVQYLAPPDKFLEGL